MKYFIKTPWWLKKVYPRRVWHINTKEKAIYLTFDDGPHPVATTFVLDELKKYNAKASFFCIGKNVAEHENIYKRILDEGHSTGNHTHQHLNGWTTSDKDYLADIEAALPFIDSDLFRPPYGRLRRSQAQQIPKTMNRSAKIIMWDVLSGDFDPSISKEKCLGNVSRYTVPGSIVVFHDSEKAFSNLAYALPRVLQIFSEMGYVFRPL